MLKYLLQKGTRWAAVFLLVSLLLASSSGVSRAQSCGGLITYGDTVYEAVPARGYTCSYTFTGAAGDLVSIKLIKRNYSLNPYLMLYDPYGTLVAYDDNSAGNYNSWIEYQLDNYGTYQIVAQGGYNLSSSGPFMLTLIGPPASP